ncbi:glutathione-disulfide reductase [Amylibacter marinus]|uniref:Glutathione reductase n=1 Tax=Amylibacter marinus TaxID=1475483 RepID=A0ABQ5VTE5_9RHOB|nr:glutathione-disulfide reductase [Amylibacter marinus]GLQ34599.1 glutathione-disulfide reductase [Amylibacter marinus]
MTFDFDLFVIGAGSGGVRAARLAAQSGASVALAEEYRYGGTCVIRGCVPKKLMVYASEFSEHFEDAAGYGWSVGDASFNWAKFMQAKNAEIDRLEGIYQSVLDNNAVTHFRTRAVLNDAHSVRLADGQVITAKHILVATGGRPFVPAISGGEHVISSNEIFELPAQPKRVLVVGGGYIACEFACILNGLGSETIQFYRGAQILRGFDAEVADFVAEEMRAKGVDLRVNTDVKSIEKTDDGLLVTPTLGDSFTVDQVLYATGRVPNTDGLGLEEVGVPLGPKGQIQVDGFSQTSVPSIYAVGDVTDRVQLTPVAIVESAAFIETVFKSNPTQPDHELIPTAVFTQPEIGTIGLSEEAARETGKIDVYVASFRPMKVILAGRSEKMLMKLIVATDSQQVLGLHIVGHGAGEMIQLAGVAIKMGATKQDFDRTMAVHPTAAEELVTLGAPTRTV